MVDYEEINAVRRGVWLIRNAEGPKPSVLNFIVWVLLIALVIVGIQSIF